MNIFGDSTFTSSNEINNDNEVQDEATAQNTASISINAANIASNTSEIGLNDTDISNLQNEDVNIPCTGLW